MKFKNLILDLDNTLYSYDSAHKEALSFLLNQFSREFHIDIEDVKKTFRIARKKTHIELPNRAASHNRLLYVQKLFELYNISSLPYALKYYNFYWDTFLNQMTLFEGVDQALNNHREEGGRICYGVFAVVIFLSLLGIVNQRVYVNRNIVPFIPSMVLIAGLMIDKIVKHLQEQNILKNQKRIYGLYAILILVIFIPLIANSKNYKNKLLPNVNSNIEKALYDIKDIKKRAVKTVDVNYKLKEEDFRNVSQVKSIPETYRANFTEVMESYAEEFKFSDIVLISEVKNNKQLTNYLLPKIFDTNVQFSNHFIFYNKDYNNPQLKDSRKKLRTIFLGSTKIREDLILEEVMISNMALGAKIFFRFKAHDIDNLIGCRFYFHGYPFENEIQRLPEKRIKHGFEGWDFTVSTGNILKKNGEVYLVTNFKPSLKTYKKFNMAIFRGCTKSEIITLENVQL